MAKEPIEQPELISVKDFLIGAWDAAIARQLEDTAEETLVDALRSSHAYQLLTMLGIQHSQNFFTPKVLTGLGAGLESDGNRLLIELYNLSEWCESTCYSEYGKSFLDLVSGICDKLQSRRATNLAQVMSVSEDDSLYPLVSLNQDMFLGTVTPSNEAYQSIKLMMPWVEIAFLTNLWYFEIHKEITSSLENKAE